MGLNDSEGLRCLRIARECLFRGDFEAAERLGKKADRMLADDSVGRAEAHHVVLQAGRKNPSKFPSQFDDIGSASGVFASGNQPTHRGHREQPSSDGPSPAHAPPRTTSAPEINKEQEEKCRAILMAKDFYKILGLSNDSSQEDIKKAYRKLALQFHPDKAKCPSAEAAFKEISRAYQCLSNPDSKAYYDRHGTTEDAAKESGHSHEAHFMSPEDLFESFFGVHLPRGGYQQPRMFRVHRTGPAAGGPQQQDARQALGLIQILPFVILILLSVLSSLPKSNDLPFSFHRNSDHNVARITHNYGVKYYVNQNFPRTFKDPGKIRVLEIQIEMAYFSSECSREQQRLLQQLQSLQFYGTADQYRKKSEELRAKEENSINCQRYQALRRQHPALHRDFVSS